MGGDEELHALLEAQDEIERMAQVTRNAIALHRSASESERVGI